MPPATATDPATEAIDAAAAFIADASDAAARLMLAMAGTVLIPPTPATVAPTGAPGTDPPPNNGIGLADIDARRASKSVRTFDRSEPNVMIRSSANGLAEWDGRGFAAGLVGRRFGRLVVQQIRRRNERAKCHGGGITSEGLPDSEPVVEPVLGIVVSAVEL